MIDGGTAQKKRILRSVSVYEFVSVSSPFSFSFCFSFRLTPGPSPAIAFGFEKTFLAGEGRFKN